jgi:hypothetical protein
VTNVKVKYIELTQNQIAIVDADLFEDLNKYKWYADRDCNTFYARRTYRNKDGKICRDRMHRVILGIDDPKLLVDHINGNGLDNRRSNLRIVNQTQNRYNRGANKNTTSKFKGVHWDKSRNKWRAKLQLNGKCIHIGYYDDEKEAAVEYNKMAIRRFGEFARLNVIV